MVNVPERAETRAFVHKGVKIHYYTWSMNSGGRKYYCWHALGNEGLHETKQEAEQAARRWIKDRQ